MCLPHSSSQDKKQLACLRETSERALFVQDGTFSGECEVTYRFWIKAQPLLGSRAPMTCRQNLGTRPTKVLELPGIRVGHLDSSGAKNR